MTRRVVVTGLGVATALGCEVGELWDKICAGKSGVGTIRRFDVANFKVRFGGEITHFNLADHLDLKEKEIKRLDRFAQFSLAAADKAIRQSGMDFTQGDPYRYGVLVGSGVGGLNEIEMQHSTLYDRGPIRVSPFLIPKMMVNAGAGNISVYWQLRGPNSAVATACASATNAIGDAYRLIQNDMADIMVTGGSEAAVTPMGVSGFARMHALSTRNDAPAQASRPFDRDRDGFVISEGAGMVVLEELEHARARGATILGEVLGYGMSADGTHITGSRPRGPGRCPGHARSPPRRPTRTGADRLHQRTRHQYAAGRQGGNSCDQDGLRGFRQKTGCLQHQEPPWTPSGGLRWCGIRDLDHGTTAPGRTSHDQPRKS